ncbi:MAG: hypothetical protein RSI33_04900 [Clostridia bacterium]
MLTIFRLIFNWHKCPKEVPASFDNAMQKACNQIIERERMKREWNDVWKKQGMAGEQKM